MQWLEQLINKYAPSFFNDSAATTSQTAMAAPSSLKQLYKQSLPSQNILITVDANHYTEAMEFARVLCAALEEELLASAYPHTDGDKIEIECQIHGPALTCLAATEQMTQALAHSFAETTRGMIVKPQCFINKLSSYQPVSWQTAQSQYRQFQLLINQGSNGR
jgi:hypothetical protein